MCFQKRKAIHDQHRCHRVILAINANELYNVLFFMGDWRIIVLFRRQAEIIVAIALAMAAIQCQLSTSVLIYYMFDEKIFHI